MRLTKRCNNLHLMTGFGHMMPKIPVYFPLAPTVRVKLAVSFRRAALRIR
jgi:hypothetical protein